MKQNTILNGDALTKLKELPEKSINMCMTSPPYWALRDYGTEVENIWDEVKDCEHNFDIKEVQAGTQHWNQGGKVIPNKEREIYDEKIMKVGFCKKCNAWKGQLGLEPTFDLYIKHLCDIFDEVKRVLRDDGTCWVNLGDTYYTKSGTNFENDNLNPKSSEEVSKTTGINKANQLRGLPHEYMQSKSLVMIPMRFAIEMVNRGWILRNTIIWHKRSCMPSSAKDRFTVDFEYIFFFSKKKKYYFETQYEKASEVSIERYKYGWDGNTNRDYVDGPQNHLNKHLGKEENRQKLIEQGRNKRTVWTINPQPFGEGICKSCGHFAKPKGKHEKEGYFGGEDKSKRVCEWCGEELITSHFAIFPEELCETPIKAGCPVGGIVLDPFFGSGTTGLVALKQSKKFVGIELNKEYIKIAKERLKPHLEQRKLSQ